MSTMDKDPQAAYDKIGRGAQRLAEGMERIGSGILKDSKELGTSLWDKSGDFASAASEGVRNFADSAKEQGAQIKGFFQGMIGHGAQTSSSGQNQDEK